ncbi:MAG: hypothetical protein M3371_02125 [Acidobacteriota bacterium]|nr:hypothetical protein [Acidobacteriota bacterium]
MDQPTLFEPSEKNRSFKIEDLLLYALGEFQARGKALAGRELPLDRLRGALRRAAETLNVAELNDEQAAAAFAHIGAQVRRVPPFVAKHPFRVTVPAAVAERARQFYDEWLAQRRENDE